jgi:phosphatidylethanolamine/phosphatidyl-N-methylethanolamine N-methyltransferase
MLRRAQMKVDQRGLTHVKSLQVMDATCLGFPDGMFDAVTAQFLITLVPDPEAALTEFERVLRPGGEIILANHFGQPSGPIAALEAAVAPLVSAIGWSSDFKASRIEAWARANGRMKVVELKPLFPGGFFQLMRIRKQA